MRSTSAFDIPLTSASATTAIAAAHEPGDRLPAQPRRARRRRPDRSSSSEHGEVRDQEVVVRPVGRDARRSSALASPRGPCHHAEPGRRPRPRPTTSDARRRRRRAVAHRRRRTATTAGITASSTRPYERNAVAANASPPSTASTSDASTRAAGRERRRSATAVSADPGEERVAGRPPDRGGREREERRGRAGRGLAGDLAHRRPASRRSPRAAADEHERGVRSQAAETESVHHPEHDDHARRMALGVDVVGGEPVREGVEERAEVVDDAARCGCTAGAAADR